MSKEISNSDFFNTDKPTERDEFLRQRRMSLSKIE
jgi:hypothetical protein